MSQELPKVFEERMREMLGDEFEAYLESYENIRQYGLRVNPLKITREELEQMEKFHLQPIPLDRKWLFLSGSRSAGASSFLYSRTLLSSGTQRYDASIQTGGVAWRKGFRPLCGSGRKGYSFGSST